MIPKISIHDSWRWKRSSFLSSSLSFHTPSHFYTISNLILFTSSFSRFSVASLKKLQRILSKKMRQRVMKKKATLGGRVGMRSEKSRGKSWGAGRPSLEGDGRTFARTIPLLCNVTLWKNELRYDSRFPSTFFFYFSSLLLRPHPLFAPFSPGSSAIKVFISSRFSIEWCF